MLWSSIRPPQSPILYDTKYKVKKSKKKNTIGGDLAFFRLSQLCLTSNNIWYCPGRISVINTLAVCYIYSAEVFPTVVRNIGLGSSSFWARIGPMVRYNIIIHTSYQYCCLDCPLHSGPESVWWHRPSGSVWCDRPASCSPCHIHARNIKQSSSWHYPGKSSWHALISLP